MVRRDRLLFAVIGAAVAVPSVSGGQVQVAAPARSTTLGRELVSFGFGAGGTVLPPFVTRVNPYDGSPLPLGADAQVVLKDGKHMLRASGRVALLVTLPEALPPDFTLEFDIVPKTCCLPEDLSFEGTRSLDQGTGSANVLWHHERVEIIGGGGNNTPSVVMPAPLNGTLGGKLTKVVFEAKGDQMRVFTNGTQVVDLPKKIFARSNKVLRVFLGGQNDTDRAVYLASMRIVSNTPAVVAGGAPDRTTTTPPSALGPSPLPVAGAPVETAQNTSGASISPTPRTLTGFAITPAKPWGVHLTWDDVPGSATFEIHYSADNGASWQWARNITSTEFKGTRFVEWAGITPNVTNQFRVIARDSKYVIVARSPVATYTAPSMPKVSNLRYKLTLGVDGLSQDVMWVWDPFPGYSKYLVQFFELKKGAPPVPVAGGRGSPGPTSIPARFRQSSNTEIRACVAPHPPYVSDYQAIMIGAECSDVQFNVRPDPVGTKPQPAPTVALAPISGFTVQSLSPWGVTFTWQAETASDGYEIQSSPNAVDWTTLESMTEQAYLASGQVNYLGLKQDLGYWLRVVGTRGMTPVAESPPHWHPPQRIQNVTKLIGVIGTPVLGASGRKLYPVSWSWDPMPGITKFIGRFYEIRRDKDTGQNTVTPIGWRAEELSSGTQGLYVEGLTMRLCVAPLVDPSLNPDDMLIGASCFDLPLGIVP